MKEGKGWGGRNGWNLPGGPGVWSAVRDLGEENVTRGYGSNEIPLSVISLRFSRIGRVPGNHDIHQMSMLQCANFLFTS